MGSAAFILIVSATLYYLAASKNATGNSKLQDILSVFSNPNG